MAGVRKILKKLAKHVKPSEPTPGFVALQISHPHEPGYQITQVPATTATPVHTHACAAPSAALAACMEQGGQACDMGHAVSS